MLSATRSMRLFLKIAVRNLLRHRKRSLITLAAVGFGVGALIFLRGFIYGAQTQMVKNITETLTGDMQIVPEAFENIYNTNGAIENPEPIRKILRESGRVTAFAERIIGSGIIASEKQSMATFLVGIDPDQETAMGTRRHQVGGRGLTTEDDRMVMLGEKMRRVLEIEMGDKVVLSVQDYYGSLAAQNYTVVGTFETGNDQIDNGTVMMLKPSAQDLLSFDRRVSKFLLRINTGDSPAAVVRDLEDPIAAQGLKILTWEDLIPVMAQMIRFQNGMFFVILTIVLAVAAAGILNTLMMSIIERVREFGLMMALGTRPSQVILLILCESFLLTASGAAAGLLMGAGFTLYFGAAGIDLSRFLSTLANLFIGSHVYPRLDWFYTGIVLPVILIANLAVSFYPAWRAGRLAPIDAMRQT